MLDRLLKGSGVLALISVACLAFQLQTETIQRQGLMEELAYYAYTQNLSALHTQKAMRDTLASVSQSVELARIDLVSSHKDAMAQVAGGLALGFGTLNTQLSQTQGLIAWEGERINSTVGNALAPYAQLGSQLSDAAGLSLDCDHNSDCIHNRGVGILRAGEKAAKAWGDAAPLQAAATTESLQNTAEITKQVKKSWFARFLNLFH